MNFQHAVLNCLTLKEMGHQQLHTQLLTYNLTAQGILSGFTNKNVQSVTT